VSNVKISIEQTIQVRFAAPTLATTLYKFSIKMVLVQIAKTIHILIQAIEIVFLILVTTQLKFCLSRVIVKTAQTINTLTQKTSIASQTLAMKLKKFFKNQVTAKNVHCILMHSH
jgi:hypothetical protein